MFNMLLKSLKMSRATTYYPDRSDEGKSKGQPRIDTIRCNLCTECVKVCPTNAISIDRPELSICRWQLDLARCVFCGLCEEVCKCEAISLTGEFELAVRNRQDLVTRVDFGLPTAKHVVDEIAIPPICETSQPNNPAWSENGRHIDQVKHCLGRSLHVRHMAAGSDNSCDWEIAALLNPVYDVQRLGIDFVASPRHADLLLVTGSVTRHLKKALLATYEAMPAPRLVVAAGNEACSGGIFQDSYASGGGVDQFLPVDVYIPGDPPSPLALIHGLLVAIGKLEPQIHRLEY